MADRIKNIITGKVTVTWSCLAKPDMQFGEASANHNVSVILTPELEAELKKIAAENGCKKINGIYQKDEESPKTIKFKSKTHVEKGSFPCQDASAQWTTAVPFKGDIVRLKLAPVVVTKPSKAMSFYLNGVQIVEKNSADISTVNGFDAVDGGFVGEVAAAPVNKTEAPSAQPAVGITDEEIPF